MRPDLWWRQKCCIFFFNISILVLVGHFWFLLHLLLSFALSLSLVPFHLSACNLLICRCCVDGGLLCVFGRRVCMRVCVTTVDCVCACNCNYVHLHTYITLLYAFYSTWCLAFVSYSIRWPNIGRTKRKKKFAKKHSHRQTMLFALFCRSGPSFLRKKKKHFYCPS